GVAGHVLLAVGEIRRVEEEQALRVGAHAELAKQPQELGGFLRAPAIEVLPGRETGERFSIEEIVQESAQREQLLLVVAAAADDRVAPLEHAARQRERALPGGRRRQGTAER